MRRVLLVLAAVVVAASLAYAVAPPRSAPAYAHRAASSLELLRSQVQTTRLWIDAVDSGEVTRPAARVAFAEAEQDARTQTAAFAAYDPPAPVVRTERLRDAVTNAGERTVALLAQVRVAAVTGQWDRLPAFADDLDGVQQQLKQQASDATEAAR